MGNSTLPNSQNGQVNPLLLVKGVIVVLLVLWMAFSLASVVGRLIPEPELADIELTNNSLAVTKKVSSKPPVDISALKNIKLFGEETKAVVAKPKAEPAPVQAKVEETKLNLELVGSFANENQNSAYAIISKGKKQELYRVNEEVHGLSNVKLTRVYADRVVLNNRGRQEALYMYPEGEPISSGSSVVSAQLNQNVANSRPANSTALAGLSTNQRLEKISDAIRFSRKTKDGKMLGFRVLPGRNRAAFDQTGLKLNDVVTAIDGQSLDNLKAANQIYQQKRNATQANLTVLRGEEELTVDVDLNNINVN
jgi:general secretion pathway protein C